MRPFGTEAKERIIKMILILSGYGLAHARGNIFPIHQIIEEISQISRALITEINIVGMFPDITT